MHSDETPAPQNKRNSVHDSENEDLLAAEESSAKGDRNTEPTQKRRRWLKRILLGIPLLLVGVVLSITALLYFAGDWVIDKAWPYIDEKLSAQGLYLEYAEVSQNGERGIVFSDVILYRDSGRLIPLVTLEDLGVQIHWRGGKAGGGPGARISFSQSQVVLETDKETHSLDGINGSIIVGASGMEVAGLVATINGLGLDIDGALRWENLPSSKVETEDETKPVRQATPPASSSSQQSSSAPAEPPAPSIDLESLDLSPVDDAMKWLVFTSAQEKVPLKLLIKFDGITDESITVESAMAGTNFSWKSIPMDEIDLQMSAAFSGNTQSIDVTTFHVGYQEKDIIAQATMDLLNQVYSIDLLESDVALHSLATDVHPPLEAPLQSFEISGTPGIALSGTIFANDHLKSQLQGTVSLPQGLTIRRDNVPPLHLSKIDIKMELKDGLATIDPLTVGLLGGNVQCSASSKPFSDPITFEGQITASQISLSQLVERRGIESDSSDLLDAEILFSGNQNQFDVSKFQLLHDQRSLNVSATIDLQNQLVSNANLVSNLDLLHIAKQIAPDLAQLRDIHLPAPPEITAEGEVSLNDVGSSKIDASLALAQGVSVKQPALAAPLQVGSLNLHAVLNERTATVTDLNAEIFEGKFSANLQARPFDETLTFSGDATGSQLSLASVSNLFPPQEGTTSSSNSTVPDLISFTLSLQGSPDKISLPSLTIDHDEGSLKLKGNYSADNQLIEMDSLKSNIDLVGIAAAAHPPSNEALQMIQFTSPPMIDMNGLIPLSNIESCKVDTTLQAVEGFTVQISESGSLNIQNLDATLNLANGELLADKLNLDAFEGSIRSRVKLRPFEEGLPFALALVAEQLSMESISSLNGSENPLPGTGDIAFKATGTTNLETINANGELDIADTDFDVLPFFGPLFSSINNLDFGIGPEQETFLRGSFSLADGILNMPDLVLKTSSMRVDTEGDVHLVDQSVDLVVRARTTGITGTVNKLTGTAFEVEATGPFDNIDYKFGGGVTGTALNVGSTALNVGSAIGGTALGIVNQGDSEIERESSDARAEQSEVSEEEEKRGAFGWLRKLNPFRKKNKERDENKESIDATEEPPQAGPEVQTPEL